MEIDENLKKVIIDRLKVVNPRKIILFGSHAYGNADEESDVDIIVIKDDVESKSRESVRMWQLLRDLPFAKDIIVTYPEEFDFYKNEDGSVFKTANEKGIEIYAR